MESDENVSKLFMHSKTTVKHIVNTENDFISSIAFFMISLFSTYLQQVVKLLLCDRYW